MTSSLPVWPDMPRDIFFLGGRDLEMVTIRELLDRQAPGRVVDRQLAWGARASHYHAEIERTLAAGDVAVLVELDDDRQLLSGRCADRVVLIDHHGPRAGVDRPTALEQIFARLQLPAEQWSRWYELVAANDRGHIRAMQAIGATADEIRHVRAADRTAQGITANEEQQGELATRERRELAGGRITVVRLPHGRTAIVGDLLERDLGGPGYVNLVIFCPQSVTVYGEGPVIEALRMRWPTGWSGGDLPERGYWGIASGIEEVELMATIQAALRE